MRCAAHARMTLKWATRIGARHARRNIRWPTQHRQCARRRATSSLIQIKRILLRRRSHSELACLGSIGRLVENALQSARTVRETSSTARFAMWLRRRLSSRNGWSSEASPSYRVLVITGAQTLTSWTRRTPMLGGAGNAILHAQPARARPILASPVMVPRIDNLSIRPNAGSNARMVLRPISLHRNALLAWQTAKSAARKEEPVATSA